MVTPQSFLFAFCISWGHRLCPVQFPFAGKCSALFLLLCWFVAFWSSQAAPGLAPCRAGVSYGPGGGCSSLQYAYATACRKHIDGPLFVIRLAGLAARPPACPAACPLVLPPAAARPPGWRGLAGLPRPPWLCLALPGGWLSVNMDRSFLLLRPSCEAELCIGC